MYLRVCLTAFGRCRAAQVAMSSDSGLIFILSLTSQARSNQMKKRGDAEGAQDMSNTTLVAAASS